MHATIKELLEKIEKLNQDLRVEYDRLAQKYGFELQKRKVVFLELFRQKNKEKKIPLYRYLIPTKLRHIRYILSIPFIYGIGIVVVIFDIAITLYQWCAFFLYRIPYVKRSEFIYYDRRFLDYLNFLEKLNCLYCSYVNGVFAYAVEIGARTERFWCPIKAAHKPRFTHGWYKDYADYGDPDSWREKMKNGEEAFIDTFGDKCFIKK